MAGTGKSSVRSYSLYVKDTTDNSNDFANMEILFVDQGDATPFTSQGVIVKNDNASPGDPLEFSFDGTTVHGEIMAGEDITFDFRREKKVYIRAVSATPFRFWAW